MCYCLKKLYFCTKKMVFSTLFCLSSFCLLTNCHDPTHVKDINTFFHDFETVQKSGDTAEKPDYFSNSGYRTQELYDSINYYVENFIPIVNDTIEEKIERLEWKLKLTDEVIRQHEQRFNRNSVALFGLPEDEGEDILVTADKAVNFFCDILEMEILRRHIDKVSRVGKPYKQYGGEMRARPVYVKFVSFHHKKKALMKGQITRGTRYGIRSWVDEQSANDKKLLYNYLKKNFPQNLVGRIVNNKIHIDGRIITLKDIKEEIEAKKLGDSLKELPSQRTKNGTKKPEKKIRFRDNKRLELFYNIPF